jgi:hypothetical protein
MAIVSLLVLVLVLEDEAFYIESESIVLSFFFSLTGLGSLADFELGREFEFELRV